MGNRVSISFKNGAEESPALFSHWGGMGFVQKAQEYVRELPAVATFSPLDRREPDTMLVDFISRVVGNGKKIESDLYLPLDGVGDNSDNGHFSVDAISGDFNQD